MTRRQTPASQRLLLAVLAWMLAVLPRASSQDVLGKRESREPARQSLRFRRVLVPEADLQDEIRGLLPLKRDEFEKRLAEAGQAAEPRQAREAAHLTRAAYLARVEGDELLQGSAELTVHSSTSTPLVLNLGSCNLALRAARWQEPDSRPAVVGQDGKGQFGCVVEGSGTLSLDWGLRGSPDPTGAATFSLQLPLATVATLRIDVPDDRTLSVEGGIASVDAGAPQVAGRQTWLVEIGGDQQIKLTLLPRSTSGDSRPLLTVREQSAYTVARSLLDLDTTLQVDALQRNLADLVLRVDHPLQITRIRSGDQPLTWSVQSRDERSTFILIAPPSFPAASSLSLEVQATGLWTADAPANLPRIALRNAMYEEGRVSVVAPQYLALQANPLRGAWQTAVTPAADIRGNDQFQFRLHDAEAAIEVEGTLSPRGLRETTGTQLVIDGAKVSAVTTSELTSLGGDYFSLEAHLPRRWIVDAVEVQPVEALSDRTLTTDAPNRQVLRLNLQRALGEDRPLRVVIRAHQRLPAGNQPLEQDFFRLVTFEDVRESRRLTAVRTTEAGMRLRLAGDQRLRRLDPAMLPEEDMRLFESVPGTVLFADDPHAGSLSATLATAAPVFRVEAALEALVSKAQTQQSLRLRCVPESTPVGRILVRLAPRPAGAITWRLVGEDPRELDVTPPPAAGSAAQNDNESAYQLTLPRPRTAPFELQADWTSSGAGATSLNLATIPDSVAQTGLVTVRSMDDAALHIESDGVESLPVVEDNPARFSSLRGRFAYRPGRRASIRVSTDAPGTPAAAVRVESLHVRSYYAADGRGDHEALLRIVNHGASQLGLQLPPSALDVRYVPRQTGAALPLARSSSGKVSVPLPSGERQVVVQLRYSSPASPLGWRPWGRFEAPLPQPEATPLQRIWSVGLAPGLQARSHTSGAGNWLLALRDGSPPPTPPSQPVLGDSFVGWSQHELLLPSGPQASIAVCRTRVVQGLGLAILLSTCVGALRLRARIGNWGWLAASALLVATIALPPEWTLFVGSAALGLAAGTFGAWLNSPSFLTPPQTSRRLIRRAGAALVFLALGGGWFAQGLADDPDEDHRVVIAANDRHEPVGDYVYLSPQFYERLHKLTGDHAAELPGWLLTAAQYHIPKRPRLTDGAPGLDEIDIRVDFATFHAGTQLELPFRRDQLSLLEGRTRLDGEPIAVTWHADGTRLLVPVESPGRHQLRLACGAPMSKTADAAHLDLTIPVISTSAVTLPLDLDPPPLIAAAESIKSSQGESNQRRYELGPSSRLVLRWPLGEPAPQAAQVEIEQLTWWKFKPGAVLVTGKFRFRPIGGTLGSLEVDIDPRLRLVPGSVSPANATVVPLATPRQGIAIVPAEKGESEFVFTADWLWIGSSGAGNLTLPRVAARGDRVVRNWTAVSVDSALQISASTEFFKKEIANDEFLIAWSEPGASPDRAADVAAYPLPLSLSLLPAAPEPAANTSALWSIDEEHARLHAEARLTQVPAARFRHTIDLPPSLKVQRLRLTSGGVPLPHRWRQRPDGAVVVTLLAPPPADQLLEIDATLPRSRNRPRLPLPNVVVQSAPSKEAIVRIYRQPEVTVQLPNATGWTPLPDHDASPREQDGGRLVAALHRATTNAPVPVITVSPNRPQVEHRLALRASSEEGQWYAEADVSLEISKGVLDVLRLEIPPNWTGPFSITPAVEYQVVAVPGTATSRLVISPQQALGGSHRFVIRGPLRNRAKEPVRVPAVAVLESVATERIIVLATNADGEPLTWETRGLQIAAPSALHLPDGWAGQNQEHYRADAEIFEAVASFPAVKTRQPSVTLAELDIACLHERRIVGHARFHIEPPASGDLLLEMPGQSSLLQVALDGVHCECRPSGLRTWRLSANTLGIPTSLEVTFASVLPSAGSGEELLLAAPRLKGLPVARSVWSLADLVPSGSNPSAASPKPDHELQAAIAKVEVFAQALARVAELAPADLSPGTMTEVGSRWHQQYLTARSQAAALLTELPSASSEWATRLSRADQIATSAGQRLEQAGLTPSAPPDSAGPSESSSAQIDPASQRTTLAFEGWREVVTVRKLNHASPADRRWTIAALMVAALVTAWLLLRVARVRDLAAAQLPAIVAAAGLGWWLLAPWPWLGWLLVGLAVWRAVASPRLRGDQGSFARLNR